MNWWKRLLFSVVSLVFGFFSLDYLYYAFRLLTAKDGAGTYDISTDALRQLVGIGMFFLWLFLVFLYLYLVRRLGNRVTVVEQDAKTGKEHRRIRYADFLLQIAFLLTGILVRWCYLMFFYFPNL